MTDARKIKVALRREAGYPIGETAPVYLICPNCDSKVSVSMSGNVGCACGTAFDHRGWILGRESEIAMLDADREMFGDDAEDLYFAGLDDIGNK